MNLYIDIVTSMLLVFLIFSVIVYVIQELIAVNLQYRGAMLWRAMAKVLDNAAFVKRLPPSKNGVNTLAKNAAIPTPITQLFFDHPQIKSLKQDDKKMCSYIPAQNAAIALLDIVSAKAGAPGNLLANFQAGLTSLANTNPNSEIVGVLQSLQKVSSTIEELQKNIETWYNQYMNRVTGWYKTHTTLTVRILAIVVTLAFNVNCLVLIKDISGNATLRTNLNNMAQGVAAHPETITGLYDKQFEGDAAKLRNQFQPRIDTTSDPAAKEKLQDELKGQISAAADKYTDSRIGAIKTFTDKLSKVQLPVGWSADIWAKESSIGGKDWGDWNYVLLILGWLLTAAGLSMGAPFWFDLLMQVVNVRRAGVKPTDGKKK